MERRKRTWTKLCHLFCSYIVIDYIRWVPLLIWIPLILLSEVFDVKILINWNLSLRDSPYLWFWRRIEVISCILCWIFPILTITSSFLFVLSLPETFDKPKIMEVSVNIWDDHVKYLVTIRSEITLFTHLFTFFSDWASLRKHVNKYVSGDPW